ncbi:MAG TPA: hypothetical protein VNS81_00680 [Nocardioides sp.]|nr:hypothetical protein [Nocardioides sp.]
MHFVSRTSTLVAALKNTDVLHLMSTPDATFIFSCLRHHVLRDDQLAPCEPTWAGDSSTGP